MNADSKPYKNPRTVVQSLLVFALGFGIFVSKPVIYISSVLLFLFAVYRFTFDRDYRSAVLAYKIYLSAIGLFIAGIAFSAIGSTQPNDVGWIARKSLYLLLIGPLLIAFTERYSRASALAGIAVGFWGALLLTVSMPGWQWSGYRNAGATWDVGTWAVICTLLICFLMPLVLTFKRSTIWLATGVATILGSLVMITSTGSRGPLLGVLTGAFVYLIFYHRRLLTIIMLASAFAFFPLKAIMPEQMTSLQNRVQSIAALTSDESNLTRLALWEVGIALFKKQLATGSPNLWVGAGHDNSTILITKFYEEEFSAHAKVAHGLLMNRPINDLHNMYLDSTLKNGVLWTIGNIILLICLALRVGTKSNEQPPCKNSRADYVALPIITAYLTIGLTYAILPHFASLFVVFFIILANSMVAEN